MQRYENKLNIYILCGKSFVNSLFFCNFAAEMKKLYIETYGCQMNVADSEVVASVMQMAGYETTDRLEEADAVFLNTCSVRDNAEQKIYHRLAALSNIKKQRITRIKRISQEADQTTPTEDCSMKTQSPTQEGKELL